jgi:undecaprenyl-diphosphatase
MGVVWLAVALILMVLVRSHLAVFEDQALFLRAMGAGAWGWFASTAIKLAVRRARPDRARFAIIRAPMDSSFPSAHAAAAFALVTAIARLHPQWEGLTGSMAAWAALVTVSRLYLGVHHPSDLLVGIGVGVFCGFGVAS